MAAAVRTRLARPEQAGQLSPPCLDADAGVEARAQLRDRLTAMRRQFSLARCAAPTMTDTQPLPAQPSAPASPNDVSTPAPDSPALAADLGAAETLALAPIAVAEHSDPASATGQGDSAEPAAPGLSDAPVASAVPDLSPAECAARLATLFPAVFTPGAPKPLKLRIQADLQQRAPGTFTKKSLSIFLHRHTTSNGYLKALAHAPARIDLDGQPAGEVSDEHRQAAVAELERRRTVHEARRAAERAAQRAAYELARQALAAQAVTPGAGAPAGVVPDAAPRAAAPSGPRHADDAGHRPRRGDDPRYRPQGGDAARRARAPTDAMLRSRDDRQESRSAGSSRNDPRDPRQTGAALGGEAASSEATTAARPAPERPGAPRPPMDEAQRARATLLHAYETTTLTRANFCALKGWSDAQLEAALVEARREREQRGPAPRPTPAQHGAGAARGASPQAPRADVGKPGRRGPPAGPRPPR
jgi:sRNA-binding protein